MQENLHANARSSAARLIANSDRHQKETRLYQRYCDNKLSALLHVYLLAKTTITTHHEQNQSVILWMKCAFTHPEKNERVMILPGITHFGLRITHDG